MYKLLLVFRYLRRRAIAYFAAAGVALCVFMMLVAISVMNGFLHKLHRAAKGLFSEIIIESPGVYGVPHYEELMDEILKVEGVEAASPFILSYGFIRIPGQDTYRQNVQIAGIRLPSPGDDAEALRRAWPAVSDFELGLSVQKGLAQPTFEPSTKMMIDMIGEQQKYIDKIIAREADGKAWEDLPPETRKAIGDLERSREYLQGGIYRLQNAEANARLLRMWQERLIELDEKPVLTEDEAQELADLGEGVRNLEVITVEPMPNRIILGLGIQGLSYRTDKGETIRIMGPGRKVSLYVIPIGQQSLTDISPNIQRMTVVDDCTTDVYVFDSETVYVSFDALQRLNNMSSIERMDGTFEPARCSMINVKVSDAYSTRKELPAVRDRIQAVVIAFGETHPALAQSDPIVQTWREKQQKIIAQLESQRTLVIIMFGILSFVSVLLVFVILYTVVVQKTRDIGVLKSVGASSGGVATIFLMFGGMIGLVGSVVGTLGGCIFMHYINSIHDALYDHLGFRVWTRESYMFDKIPNQIEWQVVATIVIGAIVASVIGAVVPALRAARMQPVEALRYE